MNISKIINIEEWCNSIIELQKKEVYNSLTSPRDFNHIIKKYVQDILEHLKSQGKTDMKVVDDNHKIALNIFLTYLKTNENWKPSKNKPLNSEELEKAFSDLYIDSYAKCDRKFTEPLIRGQNYALFSFQPTKDAKADSDGFFGMIKIRGVFNQLEEAEEKSKELIQYHSAHQIFVCGIGAPIPLKNKLSNKNDIIEVDNPNVDENALKFGDLVKEQTLKEKHQIEEIKKRVENLKEDVAKVDKDPLQIYLELSHKRATAAYLYNEHLKKLEENKNIIIQARKRISEMDENYPNLKNEYLEHYKKTCEECGIDKATDDMAVMIKKYIGEDPDLGF